MPLGDPIKNEACPTEGTVYCPQGSSEQVGQIVSITGINGVLSNTTQNGEVTVFANVDNVTIVVNADQKLEVKDGGITFDKIQNIGDGVFLGRPAGTGAGLVEEVPFGVIPNYEQDPVAQGKMVSILSGNAIEVLGGPQSLGNNPEFTVNHADTSNVGGISFTGAQVLATMSFDSFGHVIGYTARSMTAANIGALTSESDPVFVAQKGQTNGVATLDGNGKVPAIQIPDLSSTYIRNMTGKQANSNFNISGQGVIGNGLVVENGVTDITGEFIVTTTPSGGIRFNFDSSSTGEMYYRSAAGRFSPLPLGATGKILTSNGTLPVWGNAPAVATLESVLTEDNTAEQAMQLQKVNATVITPLLGQNGLTIGYVDQGGGTPPAAYIHAGKSGSGASATDGGIMLLVATNHMQQQTEDGNITINAHNSSNDATKGDVEINAKRNAMIGTYDATSSFQEQIVTLHSGKGVALLSKGVYASVPHTSYIMMDWVDHSTPAPGIQMNTAEVRINKDGVGDAVFHVGPPDGGAGKTVSGWFEGTVRGVAATANDHLTIRSQTIWNQTTLQSSSNFNISGKGSANILQMLGTGSAQYNTRISAVELIATDQVLGGQYGANLQPWEGAGAAAGVALFVKEAANPYPASPQYIFRNNGTLYVDGLVNTNLIQAKASATEMELRADTLKLSLYNGTDVCAITSTGLAVTGTVTASGGGFNSLRSLKREIEKYQGEALKIVNDLDIYSFAYDTNPEHKKYGLIINDSEKNDIRQVPAELLGHDGRYIDSYSFISILAKSIQELSKKVDDVLGKFGV